MDLAMPHSVREHFNDGSVTFFASVAPRYPNEIVQRVLSGRIACAEVRFTDGSLVFIRRRRERTTA